MKHAVVAAVLATATGPAAAQPAAPTVALAPPSTAITPEVITAINLELARAMAHLQLPDAPRPFHISYTVTEFEVRNAVASLGYVTDDETRHFVTIEARVRVKQDDVDNGNFVVPGMPDVDGAFGMNLPLTAAPQIARRSAWLVTDRAYQEALTQLRAKLDARAAGRVDATPQAWTSEPPVVDHSSARLPALETLSAMRERVEKLSARFRGQPHVRDSRVAITSYLERRWYLSSEGTSVTDGRRVSGVLMVVTGQAADGQELAQYVARYGASADDLPLDVELEAAATRISTDLAELTAAPRVDEYTGPVLFEGEGATGVVRWTLAPRLGGTPLPPGLTPFEARLTGGAFLDQVGQRVVAPTLTIVDDPTAATVTPAGDAVPRAAIAGYRFDDEGVPAQAAVVVEHGTVGSLLTTRTAARDGDRSNGHARRIARGGAHHGTITNLIVSATRGRSTAQLEHRLIALARRAGLRAALIIRQFDDPAITATTELARRELIQMAVNANPTLPPPTSLAYRLRFDGKRDLVRGVQLAEIPIAAWQDIDSVGAAATLSNYLASTASYLEHKIDGVDEGFVPTSGVESSVTAPDLLFRELDVIPAPFGRAWPLVPPPRAEAPCAVETGSRGPTSCNHY